MPAAIKAQPQKMLTKPSNEASAHEPAIGIAGDAMIDPHIKLIARGERQDQARLD